MPSKHFLRDHIRKALQDYFASLEEVSPTGIYDMVLTEVEAPLLEVIMQYTKGNQSQAAACLGLNRGTLKKLLTKYDLNPLESLKK